MLLWEWDADPEYGEVAGQAWLHLLPKKWNKQQIYSWRYDPRELSATAAPVRDARRRNASADAMESMIDAQGKKMHVLGQDVGTSRAS